MFRWLIIGGGIHGTFLSRLLTGEAGISPDDLRVLDASPVPLDVWRRHTNNCGMTWLRSPATHNIDLPILSIRDYARTPEGRPYADFIPPYYRPSLELFNRHCDHMIRENRLDRIRITGTALGIRWNRDILEVETDQEILRARHVILCPGRSDNLAWPAWAEKPRQEGAAICHVFAPDFDRTRVPESAKIVVVGGGITAVQTAMALQQNRTEQITLVSRHPVRKNNLDFDPCWTGPECLREFHLNDYEQRRDILRHARNRGTLPDEIMTEFRDMTRSGKLVFEVADIRAATVARDRIYLITDQGVHEADQVILATGFALSRPGSPLVDRMIRDMDLKISGCGYPLLDHFFRWHENIFVSGALAELQGGPCAGNIVGARNMGRELIRFIKEYQ